MEKTLTAQGIVPGEPIEQKALERSLILLEQRAGAPARAVLQPGASIGTSSLQIEVPPGPLFTSTLGVDNFGSRYTGQARTIASVQLNSPLGIGDLGDVWAAYSTGAQAVFASYQVPVGHDGLTLGASYSDFSYELCCEFAALDRAGDAAVAAVHARYPLLLSQRALLHAGFSLERKRLTDTWSGGDLEDRELNVAVLSLDGVAATLAGQVRYQVALTSGDQDLIGPPDFIANNAATIDTAGRYSKLSGQVEILHALGDRSFLNLRLSGQITNRNLDSAEKFLLGGYNGVRAYPEGEAAGDEALLARLEWVRPLQALRDPRPGDHPRVCRHRIGLARCRPARRSRRPRHSQSLLALRRGPRLQLEPAAWLFAERLCRHQDRRQPRALGRWQRRRRRKQQRARLGRRAMDVPTMNTAYRLIWNHRLSAWAVAAELVRARGKRSSGRVCARLAVALLAAAGGPAAAAELAPGALPGGGTVVVGQADITTNGTRMDITQGSQRAIINWQGFDIGSQALVNFAQPNDSSVTLNRVSGPSVSRIEGQITANGQVFLINPNGVLFGSGARVNAAALVASTLNIRDDDFLTGRYAFSGTGGAIENLGAITATPGGYVALIAPQIINGGTLSAPQGTVALAGGERVTLNFAGNRLVGLSVSAETLDTLIDNRQAIRAEGGAILLTAAGAESVTRSVINQTGVLEASSLTESGGRIVLSAGDDINLGSGSTIAADGQQGGEISVQAQSGTLLAGGLVSARGEAGTGGKVELLGNQVGLVNAARVDASGRSGGGTVLVGGDYQGNNHAIQNARRSYVGADAVIVADARQDGDGGKVIVWADEATQMYGSDQRARRGEQWQRRPGRDIGQAMARLPGACRSPGSERQRRHAPARSDRHHDQRRRHHADFRLRWRHVLEFDDDSIQPQCRDADGPARARQRDGIDGIGSCRCR